MEILTTIIYLFRIKTWNFLYKNPRVFYSIFLIATNIANKPPSDCITSPKTILPFHFSPKPTAEGEIKRQQTKQLQFHKINTKKKELMSQSYYLTPIKPSFQHLSIRPLEQTVKFVCSSLNVTNPKNPKAFKMHLQPNKLFQTYQNQLIFRLQVVTTLFKISDNHSTSALVKFISILLGNTISFYYLAPLSSCSAQKIF